MLSKSKLIAIIILSLLFVSCWKEEFVDVTKLTHEFNQDQPMTIEIEVVAMEEAVVQFEDMIKEVNADYFNRYGIAVRGEFVGRDTLTHKQKFENEIFLPYDKTKEGREKIIVYVLPKKYIYPMAGAYAMVGHNAIVLSEDFQTNRTLAHEIGHLFGLDHIKRANNVMDVTRRAEQYDVPNDFDEDQIETIYSYLNNN